MRALVHLEARATQNVCAIGHIGVDGLDHAESTTLVGSCIHDEVSA